MKNITIVKIILILIIGVMLLAIPANVFAATDLNDYLEGWEDLELEPETTPETTTPETTTPSTGTTTTPSTGTTTTNTSTPENTYSDAGLAEDTIMVVAIIVLGTTAIYAYRKINEYNNI